ncbi:MAG: hypothetical protein ACOVOG_03775 [Rubrivivax sp.]|jgi:hypothetical protein
MAALTEQRLAAADHRLAAAVTARVGLRVDRHACQAQVEREAVPSQLPQLPQLRQLPLYQRLLLRWHCPAQAEVDNWSLDFRLLTNPDVGHVAAGRAVLPDGSRQPLLFDGREPSRAALWQAPGLTPAVWLTVPASASALGLAVCVLLAWLWGGLRASRGHAD